MHISLSQTADGAPNFFNCSLSVPSRIDGSDYDE